MKYLGSHKQIHIMIQRIFALTICFMAVLAVYGQQFDTEYFKAMNFRSIGPAGMSGRITAIDVDLSNPENFCRLSLRRNVAF